MATLTASPASPNAGDPVTFVGDGYTPAAVVTFSIPETGYSSEIVADAAGYFGSDDVADHATTTLTSSGVNVSDGDVVTLGAVTYRFKTTMAQANDVKIGADAATSLATLKKAINATGVVGTDYFTGTVVHPTISALTLTATTLLLGAKTGGTGGNALASTKTAVTLSFPGGTLTGGSASTGVSAMLMDFEQPGTYECKATDGTNTGTCSVQVFAG